MLCNLFSYIHVDQYALNFIFRGPPRFEGDRPRFGDREGYRSGPRGGGEFGGDKGGAPADFQPSFRVCNCYSYLRIQWFQINHFSPNL